MGLALMCACSRGEELPLSLCAIFQAMAHGQRDAYRATMTTTTGSESEGQHARTTLLGKSCPLSLKLSSPISFLLLDSSSFSSSTARSSRVFTPHALHRCGAAIRASEASAATPGGARVPTAATTVVSCSPGRECVHRDSRARVLRIHC